MALIRICVVPNCSQRLSWLILWIVTVCVTYWTHTTAVCVLMVALTHLQLPTRDRPIMLIFYLLCYAAVLIKFTYYAQNYAQEKELCLVYFHCFIRVYL